MNEFYLDEYIEQIAPELTQYRYSDDEVIFKVENNEAILCFSSVVEQVGPESWDVMVTITENDEVVYYGTTPSNAFNRLCEKYDGYLFEEIVD